MVYVIFKRFNPSHRGGGLGWVGDGGLVSQLDHLGVPWGALGCLGVPWGPLGFFL